MLRRPLNSLHSSSFVTSFPHCNKDKNKNTSTDGSWKARTVCDAMRAPMIRILASSTMLDDAPWTWGSTGGWSQGMPQFFQVCAWNQRNSHSGLLDLRPPPGVRCEATAQPLCVVPVQ